MFEWNMWFAQIKGGFESSTIYPSPTELCVCMLYSSVLNRNVIRCFYQKSRSLNKSSPVAKLLDLRSKSWLGNHNFWPHIIIWILTVCYRVLLWRCYTGLKLTSVPWWYLQREKDHPVKWCCERVNARITAPFPFVYTFNFIHIDSSIYTHTIWSCGIRFLPN